MTKFEQDGQEFEYVRWGDSEPGDYFLRGGTFVQIKSEVFRAHEVPIFRKKMKRHVIGGVEFEETGEARYPIKGDWYLGLVGTNTGYWSMDQSSNTLHIIIRPVRMV